MAVTRINNNQISDASAGNTYVGINASTKIQPYSVTATKLANNLTYNSDLTVAGNLTVQGNTTTIDTTYTTVEDPTILLASNQTGTPALDIGFIGQRGVSQNIGWVWVESAKEFSAIYTTTGESNTTVSIASYANIHASNANIGGNMVVNGTTSFVGNIIGNVSLAGNITMGNVLTNGQVSAGGNITGGNLLTGGLISATGNITSAANVAGGNLLATTLVSAASHIGSVVSVSANITGGNLLTDGLISATGNITSASNIAGGNILATTLVNGASVTGTIISASANITGGNLLTGGLISATSTITSAANITGGNLLTSGIASASSVLGSIVSASANITGGNLLTGGLISSTGNISSAGNISASYFLGNGSQLTGVTATTSGFPITAGTSNIAAATNGNIGVTVAGTSNVVTFASTGEYVTGLISASGNITGGNVNTGGIVSATSNILSGANLVHTGYSQGNGFYSISSFGGTYADGIVLDYVTGNGRISVGTNDGLNLYNGSTVAGNLIASFNTVGALTLGATGTANLTAGNISGGNLLTSGIVSATSNITGGNLLTGGLISATSTITSAANVTGGNLLTGGQVSSTGNITSAANVAGGNVLATTIVSGASVLGSIVSASANITGGNILTGGLISATGNITSAANVSGGNVLATTIVSGASVLGSIVSASANITGGNLLTAGIASASSYIGSVVSVSANVTGGNILTGGIVSATSNITGGNILTGGIVSATSNITSSANITGGNLLTGGQVSATGNVTGGNVNTNNLVGTGVTITSTGSLTFAPTSNVLMSSKNINNLADPVQPQDAATKNYVDNVAQGLDPKASVVYATTASIFGSGYTYNNGTSGVGATLTAAAVGNLTIDGTVVSAGQRVLIKNETGAFVNNTTQSAAFNGIYTVTTAGSPSVAYVLTRTTDFDQGTEMASAFTFVEDGSTNADTGWVCTANSPITVGTTQITWAQFSGAGSYSANTSAGLSLVGTIFSAKVDNNTTDFDGGGNIIVKASANLTTPNIGAATGTSLSVTGTVTAASTVGGVITGSSASVTGNVTGGNIVTTGNIYGANLILTANESATGFISTTGNITSAANVTGGNLLTGGQVSATGNITSAANIAGGNLLITTTVSAASHIGSIVSVSANVTGGNILTGGLISATGNITSAANVSGGNILSTALVQGVTVSASGNVIGGNVTTAGQVSATGNITSAANIASGNLLATTSVSAASHIGSVVSVSSNITGGNILTGGLISATSTITSAANITGGNLLTGGLVSSTGNITSAANVSGGNILTGGLISATSTITSAANISGGNLTTAGTVTAATVNAATIGNTGAALSGATVSASANITGGNLLTGGLISSTGNISSAGNISASYFLGNGSQLTGISAVTSGFPITAGTSNIAAATNGNIGVTVAGTSNVVTFASTGEYVTGLISASGNITSAANVNGGNLVATTIVSGASHIGSIVSASANITGGNLLTGGIMSATGNIYSGSKALIGVSSTTLTNPVAVFSGSGASYDQVAIINSTGTGSADLAVYGNNGDDSQSWTDVGFTGNTFSDTNYTITAAGDGYLFAQGNSSFGGNLVIATGNTGTTRDIVFSFGWLSANEFVRFQRSTNTILPYANTTANIGSSSKWMNNIYGGTHFGTTASMIGNVIGGNINTSTLTLNASTINSNASRITVNSALSDVDFAVSGTLANVFYIDAGANTASFGSSTQTTNAIVAFNATNSVLMPVGNTLQRPGTGVTGMLRFNTTSNAIEVYDNSQWSTVGTPSFTVISDQQFNGDGSNVNFTLTSSATTTNSTIVSINGIVQIPTIAYSVGGANSNVVTFTEAPQTGDLIDVRVLTTTTSVTSIGNSPGNAVIAVNPTVNEISITGNLVPVSNVTQSLGTATQQWKSLYVSGNTIYLGGLQLQSSGNTLNVYQSDGSTLANLGASGLSVTSITDGTSAFQFAGVNGNAVITAGGANTVIVTSTGANVSGYVTSSGNITGGNIITSGQLVSTIATGTAPFSVTSTTKVTNLNVEQVDGFHADQAGTVSTIVVRDSSGYANVAGLINSGANGVGNIGSSSLYFNTAFVKATSAQYADLAENYAADAEYAPGTVLSFGGSNEVTVSKLEGDRRIAGVVSTNPSFIMNSVLEAEHVATIALTGRVPTFVSGPVEKGDMMVSAGNGRAIACATPAIGTVIGKALEDHAGGDGIIEVVVGRL